MSFSYLDSKNIFDLYEKAKSYTDQLTRPFPEFERISRNRPLESISKELPKVTDGTTASILRKIPKRILQQLPTGVVTTDDDSDWLPIVAEFIYLNKILPYANAEYSLTQKCWTHIERAVGFGASASYSPFLNHDGYFCPDMTLPYWGDIFIQPGKKSGYDCDYLFMRSWWQKEDIKSLIVAEKKRKKSKTYKPTWDVAALEDILDAEVSKDQQGQTPSEQDRGTNPTAVQLVTGFQKGVNANFFVFNPDKKKTVRTKPNKDPRGKIPVDWMYGDTDGTNPLGRGIIELIGGLQNLMDGDMQAYQYNRALMLAPPLKKRGNVTNVAYAPNNIIDMGTDPNSLLEALTVDTSAIANYPELYGLQKSQLLNLVSSPDTSISAEVGNPGFGKTPTAINEQKANVSVDDNYIRKMFEEWFENWSETAINLYFAERSGMEALQLDDETAMKLRKLAGEGNPVPVVDARNRIQVDYDTATPALKFRINASTSKMKDDAQQLQALSGLLETIDSNQLLASIVGEEKIAEIYNSIVAASGVEDPEKLSINMDEFKEKMRAQREAAAQAQGIAEAPQKPVVNYKDAPEDVKRQLEMKEGLQPSQMASPTQQDIDQKQQQINLQAEKQVTDADNERMRVEADAANESQLPEDGQTGALEAGVPAEGEVPADEPMLTEQPAAPAGTDDQIIDYLRQLNLPDDVIQVAMQAAEAGATSDEILNILGVTSGN